MREHIHGRRARKEKHRQTENNKSVKKDCEKYAIFCLAIGRRAWYNFSEKIVKEGFQ